MTDEVLVGSVRRRRRSSPGIEAPRGPNVRNWIVYTALALVLAGLMFNGYLRDRPARLPLPERSQATDVRSTVWEASDSLHVVVGWDLSLAELGGSPDTVRVKVIPDAADTLILSQHGAALADTAYLPAPKEGQTVKGLSCVAAQYDGREAPEEVCTPWQYVRPLAEATAGASGADPATQIVIQPSGLQVDPDLGGRCAEWQRNHSPDSVWISVNRTAVAECTGPNRKPVVAQFCAFVVMPDGRKLKTANSSNNRYCDELFREWIRERYS